VPRARPPLGHAPANPAVARHFNQAGIPTRPAAVRLVFRCSVVRGSVRDVRGEGARCAPYSHGQQVRVAQHAHAVEDDRIDGRADAGRHEAERARVVETCRDEPEHVFGQVVESGTNHGTRLTRA
jgi:hypothetical protein